jgi:hypothetical protein
MHQRDYIIAQINYLLKNIKDSIRISHLNKCDFIFIFFF